MDEITADRLGPAGRIPELKKHPPAGESGSGGKRQPARPRTSPEDEPAEPEEHQIDSLA